jgi:hypothetical protein
MKKKQDIAAFYRTERRDRRELKKLVDQTKRCARHPKYEAKRPPTSGCLACMRLWIAKSV